MGGGLDASLGDHVGGHLYYTNLETGQPYRDAEGKIIAADTPEELSRAFYAIYPNVDSRSVMVSTTLYGGDIERAKETGDNAPPASKRLPNAQEVIRMITSVPPGIKLTIMDIPGEDGPAQKQRGR